MKYIVMQRKIGDDMIQEIPIIFPDVLVHKHVAMALLRLPGNPYNFINKVASAGTIEYSDAEFTCSGNSSTLKISSRGEVDEQLILNCEYGRGFK